MTTAKSSVLPMIYSGNCFGRWGWLSLDLLSCDGPRFPGFGARASHFDQNLFGGTGRSGPVNLTPTDAPRAHILWTGRRVLCPISSSSNCSGRFAGSLKSRRAPLSLTFRRMQLKVEEL